MKKIKKPGKEKTKILAAGDIHGDRGLVKKLAKKAKKENVDLIILAGDLAFWDDETKGLIGPFAKLKKPVLLLHGNHESLATIDFLSEMYSPEAKNLHGYSFLTKNKIGIFGAGGSDLLLLKFKENLDLPSDKSNIPGFEALLIIFTLITIMIIDNYNFHYHNTKIINQWVKVQTK